MVELAGSYILFLPTIRNIVLNIKMPEKDLINFLKKIEQLNKITELIEKNPMAWTKAVPILSNIGDSSFFNLVVY